MLTSGNPDRGLGAPFSIALAAADPEADLFQAEGKAFFVLAYTAVEFALAVFGVKEKAPNCLRKAGFAA